jgi:hypothetical protein
MNSLPSQILERCLQLTNRHTPSKIIQLSCDFFAMLYTNIVEIQKCIKFSGKKRKIYCGYKRERKIYL